MAYLESCSRYRLRTRPFATEAALDEWLDSKRPRPLNRADFHPNPIIAASQMRQFRDNLYWCKGCDQCQRLEVDDDLLEAYLWFTHERFKT